MTDKKKNNGYLTKSELEKFRALLWEKRNELLGNVSYMEKIYTEQPLKNSPGVWNRMEYTFHLFI